RSPAAASTHRRSSLEAIAGARCAMTLTIGIDPGLNGALAVLASDGTIELLVDLPVIRDRSLAWIDGAQLQSTLLDALQGRTARAVVERVSAMPRQGVASSFVFGVGF